jgi:hypothetical protein
MELYDKVIITDEAMGDNKVSSNEVAIIEFFSETTTGNDTPTDYVRVINTNLEVCVVGVHEIIFFRRRYNGWTLEIYKDNIIVSKFDESRLYTIPNVGKMEVETFLQDRGYTNLNYSDGTIQIKFEDNDFLVIDNFDLEDELIESIGCHVFGETLDLGLELK